MPITPSLIPLPWCAFFSQVMGTSLNHRHTLGHHSHSTTSMGTEGSAPKGVIPTVLSCFGHGEHAPGVTASPHARAGECMASVLGDLLSPISALPQSHFSPPSVPFQLFQQDFTNSRHRTFTNPTPKQCSGQNFLTFCLQSSGQFLPA